MSPETNIENPFESLRQVDSERAEALREAVEYLNMLRETEASVRIKGTSSTVTLPIDQEDGRIAFYTVLSGHRRDDKGNVIPLEIDSSTIISVERDFGGYAVNIARGTDGGYVTFPIDRIQELEVIDGTDG